MACEVLFYGGFIDGDEIQDPGTGDYVAGQPCEISATGIALCTTDADMVGVFKNDKPEDDAANPQAAEAVAGDVGCGVIVGANKVLMSVGTLAAGTTQAAWIWPASGAGWAVGDELFNDGSGQWDNTGGGAARGRVTKAPASATDTLIAWMYGV